MSTNLSNVKDLNDIVKVFEEDADPQTVFYLNPVYSIKQDPGATNEGLELLRKTLYFWAPKIEMTVREKLKTSPSEHVTAQASWNRASFRSKLLDSLMKSTPWMTMGDSAGEDRSDATLTGEYHHDKAIFRDLVTSYLQSANIPLTDGRLSIIPNYISEAMTLAAGKLQRIQRFAVLSPSVTGMGSMTRESMRLVLFSFEQNNPVKNGGVALQTIKTEYEAVLNRKLFEDQDFDEESLKIGKALVQKLTVDVAM